jgi:DNA polymerase-3 subunit alpha
MKLGKDLGLSVVLTNDSHYVHKDDWQAHEVLLCLQTGKTLLDEGRMTMHGGDYSLRDYDSMMKNFSEYPEVAANTMEISEKCNVDFELGKILIPYYNVPEGETPENLSEKAGQRKVYRKVPQYYF